MKTHYYLSLLPFVLSFTMLITLVFFYDDITKGRHKAVFYSYTVIMVSSIRASKYTAIYRILLSRRAIREFYF